ncbi:MAG: glycoside hydrolase family 15 protein [Parvibaculaceae bacterium]
MSTPIEDYGFIGNMNTCALVSRDGSIDWLCVPRFDSDACFAVLLGDADNGRWLIAPEKPARHTSRRYLPGTAILETTFETEDGTAAVTDFLPLTPNEASVELIRLVRGIEGCVKMKMELAIRFGYGRTVPWVRRRDYGLQAIAGPDAIDLVTPVALRGENMHTTATFDVRAGESVPFTMAYHASNARPRFIDDRALVLEQTAKWWREWSSRCKLPDGVPARWREAVLRSLITLKALTFRPTGAIVAAGTTSLPEQIGGGHNWDYRFCWIRDAALTIYALLNSRYFEEADAFRDWLLRAAAGHPEQMQIMYGVAGERRLTEIELPWLAGFEGSKPVRIGNAASEQLQLDVYGELMDAFYASRRSQIEPHDAAWRLQKVLLKNLEHIWQQPDRGIWEGRGDLQHFTHSKIMCWAAFDRAIKTVEKFGEWSGPVDKWRALREEIRADILANGFSAERNSFVRYYGSTDVDAALLQIAPIGFLTPDDPRFAGTVAAVEQDLLRDGFVIRYRRDTHTEGTFLVCSFWLVDAYALLGRREAAKALFERILSVRNDLGLLSEEYDPQARRLLGNFPQAYSHVGLINSACNLLNISGPSTQRASTTEPPQSAGRKKEKEPSTMDSA